MKNKRWYFRSYRKLARQFVFLPSEWYHAFLNKNNSWKISNKRKSLSVFFHEMCVYWAALLWTLPALTTREDVTRSPWMSGTNTERVAQLLASRHPALREVSKGRQLRKVVIVPFPIICSGLCEHLPKEKNEELMDTGQVKARSLGRKNCKPL